MFTSDSIKRAIASMDDQQLVEGWRTGRFVGDAYAIAEAELRRRGIDPGPPAPGIATSTGDVALAASQPSASAAQPTNNPGAFSMPALGTTPRSLAGVAVVSALVALLGMYVAGSVGAAIVTVTVIVFGWSVGGFIARTAHARWRLKIRLLICVLGLFAWLLLSGVGPHLIFGLLR